jgi:hypothetical protein
MMTELVPLRYDMILKIYMATDRNTVWPFSRGYFVQRVEQIAATRTYFVQLLV